MHVPHTQTNRSPERPGAQATILVRNFQCRVHCPLAGEGTAINGLPPAAPVPVFDPCAFDLERVSARTPALRDLVEQIRAFMAVPGRAVRFFLAKLDRGMWLDFRPNDGLPCNTAAIINMGGINAITGQAEGQPYQLTWYAACPFHQKENVGNDSAACKKCQLRYPKQNFLGNAAGIPWIDGFRTTADNVNQFVFARTESGLGVAQQMLGEERFTGFTIAFFSSPGPKQYTEERDMSQPTVKEILKQLLEETSHGYRGTLGGSQSNVVQMRYGNPSGGPNRFLGGTADEKIGSGNMAAGSEAACNVSHEIAAGAKIEQRITPDPLGPKGWQRGENDRGPEALVWLLPLDAAAFEAFLACHPTALAEEAEQDLGGFGGVKKLHR